MRYVLAVLLLFGCGASGPEALSPAAAEAMVLKAAEVPRALLDEVSGLGPALSPDRLSSLPLSLLLLSVRIEADSDDLRRLAMAGDGTWVPPWAAVEGGNVTFLTAEGVTDVEVKTDGSRATGSFRFRREQLAQGRATFVAEADGETWRIVELALPATGDAIRRGPDGAFHPVPGGD